MPQISQLSAVFASQLFWLALVFGLIFFGIGRGMLPKVRSTIGARERKIADDLEKARAARAKADETEAAWRARMDEARVEAARIAQEAKQESARNTERRVNEALVQIDAKVESARVRIWTSVRAARAEMEVVAAEAAQQMVEQLTGMKIDKNDAAKAVTAELQALGPAARREHRAEDAARAKQPLASTVR
jgi:F-type H+-transporting ATPase subunit b